MLRHGSVGANSKVKKRNLTLTLTITINLLLLSIVFHDKNLCLYHNFYGFIIFTAYSRLIFYMRRSCQLEFMLEALLDTQNI